MNRIEVEEARAMTDALEAAHSVPNYAVQSHTHCRHCGYDLHGLSAEGRCPECGARVADSLGEALLVAADPKWLTSLVRGLHALLIGFGLVILLVIASVFIGSSPMFEDARLALFCLSVAGIICWFAAGGWALSTPDPSGQGEREYGTARKIARWALVLGALQGFLDCVALFYADRSFAIAQAVLSETALAQIVGVVGVFAHLQYLQKLMLRVPNRGFSASARTLKLVLPLLWGFFYLVTLLGMITPTVSVGLLLGLALIIGLIGLLFGLGYLGFLVSLERCLSGVLAEANRNVAKARIESQGS